MKALDVDPKETHHNTVYNGSAIVVLLLPHVLPIPVLGNAKVQRVIGVEHASLKIVVFYSQVRQVAKPLLRIRCDIHWER